jgi:hypothetical protein
MPDAKSRNEPQGVANDDGAAGAKHNGVLGGLGVVFECFRGVFGVFEMIWGGLGGYFS